MIHNQLSTILNCAVDIYGLKDNVTQPSGTLEKKENGVLDTGEISEIFGACDR